MKKNKLNKLFQAPTWDDDAVQENNNFTKNMNDKYTSCKLLERIKQKCKDTSKDIPKTSTGISKKSKTIKKTKRKKNKLKEINTVTPSKTEDKPNFNLTKLKSLMSQKTTTKDNQEPSFRDKLWEKLKGSRFRYLNEQMYTSKGNDSQKMFEKDPSAFEAYHEGFRHQVEKWPLNPLDIIINEIKRLPTTYMIGDFGCGEAKLAMSVPQTVKSFDLVSLNENVIASDMAKVPLKSNSLDVAVYCLSLMGVNIKDYLLEANRVLKMGATLKIAEVSSRFTDVNEFIKLVSKYGFKLLNKNLSHEMFYFMNFKKILVPNKSNVPKIELKSCLYKKR